MVSVNSKIRLPCGNMESVNSKVRLPCGNMESLNSKIRLPCGNISPFHGGCFGLASSERAKGAIAFRFHSEKLIRSLANKTEAQQNNRRMAKLVITWWHNERVC